MVVVCSWCFCWSNLIFHIFLYIVYKVWCFGQFWPLWWHPSVNSVQINYTFQTNSHLHPGSCFFLTSTTSRHQSHKFKLKRLYVAVSDISVVGCHLAASVGYCTGRKTRFHSEGGSSSSLLRFQSITCQVLQPRPIRFKLGSGWTIQGHWDFRSHPGWWAWGSSPAKGRGRSFRVFSSDLVVCVSSFCCLHKLLADSQVHQQVCVGKLQMDCGLFSCRWLRSGPSMVLQKPCRPDRWIAAVIMVHLEGSPWEPLDLWLSDHHLCDSFCICKCLKKQLWKS